MSFQELTKIAELFGRASSGEKHQQGRSPSAQFSDNTIAVSDTFPLAKGT